MPHSCPWMHPTCFCWSFQNRMFDEHPKDFPLSISKVISPICSKFCQMNKYHNNLSVSILLYTSYLVSVTYFGHWNVASITEWCDRKIKLAFSITLAVKFFASSDRPQPGNIPISTGAGKTINKHYSYICILVFYKCYFSAALLGNVRAFKRNLQHKMPVNALWHF